MKGRRLIDEKGHRARESIAVGTGMGKCGGRLKGSHF